MAKAQQSVLPRADGAAAPLGAGATASGATRNALGRPGQLGMRP